MRSHRPRPRFLMPANGTDEQRPSFIDSAGPIAPGTSVYKKFQLKSWPVRGPYFLTVNGTEYSVFSQDILIRPPPDGFFVTAIVNWSTGEVRADLVRSTRAKSFFSSTGTPHAPIFLLMANFEVPDSSGTM